MPNGVCGPIVLTCPRLQQILQEAGELPEGCVLAQGQGITVLGNGNIRIQTQNADE
jgi:hypothetical protein